jgi:transposase-like protein
MSPTARESEQHRKVQVRLRIVRHNEEVSRHVCRTCRVFGVSRSQFYVWLRRYRQLGEADPPGWPSFRGTWGSTASW